MSGEILSKARTDIKRFLNGGFSTELTITPTGEDPVVINGLITRHSQDFDSEALPIVSENCHCSFSEIDLNDLGVVTRDAKGDVNIKGWKIEFADAISTESYKFAEPEPDKTLGIIKTRLVILE